MGLYITSPNSGSGKTAVAAALGKKLSESGRKIGFLKPILSGQADANGDAVFMKKVLGLSETPEAIQPEFAGEQELVQGIKAAYDRVAVGKDLVIIEGASNLSAATRKSVVSATGSRVINIEAIATGAPAANGFGDNLLGAIINRVPAERVESLKKQLAQQPSDRAVKVLGVIPEDNLTAAITIGELAELAHGELIIGVGKSGELIENMMIGAMNLDSGAVYYGRMDNKAAFIRTGRPDMQLAALATSTKCLVLAGKEKPAQAVLDQAAGKDVAVITTPESIADIAERVEKALAESRLISEDKLARFTQLLGKELDLQALAGNLGPAK